MVCLYFVTFFDKIEAHRDVIFMHYIREEIGLWCASILLQNRSTPQGNF